jgi:hypothetical protein
MRENAIFVHSFDDFAASNGLHSHREYRFHLAHNWNFRTVGRAHFEW